MRREVMALSMDVAALTAFLTSNFAELTDEFVVERVEESGLDLRLRVASRHLRPGGTVSGPTLFTLADVAVYLAILSRIGPKALTVTTNASIDFLRKPAAGRDITATARILKLGRVLVVGEVLIYSEGVADPVARASLTYSIPPQRV
jgi:uncharacterized protein (TIGR00369 family)